MRSKVELFPAISGSRMDTQFVLVTYTVFATTSEVYAAFTIPDVMQRWMGELVTADVRLGGTFQIEINQRGHRFIHIGKYLVLETDRRILQSFHAEPATKLSLKFENFTETLEFWFTPKDQSETEVTLRHEWLGNNIDDETVISMIDSWREWLERIQAVFGRN